MKKKWLLIVPFILLMCLVMVPYAHAEPLPDISINIGNNDGEASGTSTITILLLITVLSVAPAILVLMTSFTRIVIVLSFVKTSMGTNTVPPAQVLVGLAMFLTFFVMAPTFNEINQVALQPYVQG